MHITRLIPETYGAFKELIAIFHRVFEHADTYPSDTYLKQLLSNEHFWVYVIEVDGKVVGGLTAYVLNGYYSECATLYIYDVGIAPEYQHRGLGKALMKFICLKAQEAGLEQAYVEAEQDDEDAVRFYRTTDADNEMPALHFTYYLHPSR